MKHMIQIAPIIHRIHGWGCIENREVVDVQHRCNLVTSFTIRMDEGCGDMVVRRIEGTGADYAEDMWIIDTGLSSVRAVPRLPEGAKTPEFKRGMY